MTFIERIEQLVLSSMLARVVLAWVMISALLVLTSFSAIQALQFPDPDDIMRLLQVRDVLAGQYWFDLSQHRVDAPNGGVPMHWSRLVDLPLIALIALLTPLLGGEMAEIVAAVIIPLFTLAVAMLLAARVAWRLLGAEATGFTCLAMALSVPLIAQMLPLRIDHHGWQIVCALAAVNGLIARSPRRGGWIIGASLAIWLSISIEGLPLAAAICGLVALRWLRDPQQRQWFVTTMQALAVSSILLFLATHGTADLVQHCDAISPIHLGIFTFGAIAATILARFEKIGPAGLLLGLGLVAAGAVVMLYSVAPQCLGGGFAELDPTVRNFWYDAVGEGLPVWEQGIAWALRIVIPPLIAIWAAMRLAGGATGWLRAWWTEYALLLAAALIVAVFVARAGSVAGALAAIPLGWQLVEWLRLARNITAPTRRLAALAGISLALLPALPVTIFSLAAPANSASQIQTPRASSCKIPQAAKALRGLPKGEILAPLDIGPRLLYETDHGVIATGHHRGNRGMKWQIETFTGSSEAAHERLQARGTAYLALCPDLAEPARYVQAWPDSFIANLLKGEEADWLEPVEVPANSNFKIWKIRR